MLAITPSGSWVMRSCMPSASCNVRGASVASAASRKKSIRPSRPFSSLRDWRIGLPTSEVRMAASLSRWPTMPSRKRRMQASLCSSGRLAQEACAARAARYLAATDSGVSVASSASVLPLAGLVTLSMDGGSR